jgi:cell division protein ZapA
MNTLSTDTIRVKIFGREYELDPGSLTPLEASQLAAYVDQKMREISEKLRLVDTQKIAVLAALNIAFEMSQPSGEPPSLTEEDQKRIDTLLADIDKALSS